MRSAHSSCVQPLLASRLSGGAGSGGIRAGGGGVGTVILTALAFIDDSVHGRPWALGPESHY